MPFGKCRLCGRHIINPLLDTFLPHQNKIKCPSRLEEAFHCDDFCPPDWRKVSTGFNKAKVTAERVGNVSDAQAIICRKALKQEKKSSKW